MEMEEATNEDEASERGKCSSRRRYCCGLDCSSDAESLESWLLLVRIALYNALTGINFSCFGVLYVEYTEYFRDTKSAIGWVVAIQGMIMHLLGIFVSQPLERFGCSRVAFVGSLIGSSGLALSALAPNLAVLYVTQGFIAGCGFCISALPSPVILQQHFNTNHVFANGMAHLGYSMGHVIGPPLTQLLHVEYGWRGCILLLAGLMANQAPLGLTFWPKTSKKRPPGSKSTCGNVVDFSLFKEKRFLIFCIGSMLQKFYTIAFINHLPSFVVYKGYSLKEAAFLASLLFTTNTVLKVIIAFVSNIKGVDHFVQFTGGTFLGVVSIVILLCVPGYIGLVLGTLITGLHLGVCITIIWIILVDLLSVEVIARSLALYNFLIGIVTLFSTPLCGWIYDVTDYYEASFMVMAAAISLATVIFSIVTVWVRQTKKQDIPQGLQEKSRHSVEAEGVTGDPLSKEENTTA